MRKKSHFNEAERILEKHKDVIISICKKYALYNPKVEYQIDWEDLYQECCLRFYEKWSTIKKTKVENMRYFLIIFCRNCCYNVVRDTRTQIPKDLISIMNIWKLKNNSNYRNRDSSDGISDV